MQTKLVTLVAEVSREDSSLKSCRHDHNFEVGHPILKNELQNERQEVRIYRAFVGLVKDDMYSLS